MELLLVYSNKCKNSQIVKNYDIFNKIDKLNIDNKSELKQLPKYVNSVPTLIIKKNEKLTILKNNELLHYFKADIEQQFFYICVQFLLCKPYSLCQNKKHF